MNIIYIISGQYYARFWGSHHLPRWHNWRWLLCITSSFAIALFSYWLIVDNTPPIQGLLLEIPLGLATLCFFTAGLSIIKHSRDQEILQSTAPLGLPAKERLYFEKRKYLSHLIKRPSSEFLSFAEEITKMQELEKTYRTPIDPDFWRLLRKLCEPQFITSVIAIVLSAFAIFVTFIDKSVVEDISSSFKGQNSFNPFVEALFLTLAFGLLLVLIYTLLRQIIEILALFLACFTTKKFSSNAVLNCLIRDLIRLHIPYQVHDQHVYRKAAIQPKPTPRLKSFRRINRNSK